MNPVLGLKCSALDVSSLTRPNPTFSAGSSTSFSFLCWYLFQISLQRSPFLPRTSEDLDDLPEQVNTVPNRHERNVLFNFAKDILAIFFCSLRNSALTKGIALSGTSFFNFAKDVLAKFLAKKYRQNSQLAKFRSCLVPNQWQNRVICKALVATCYYFCFTSW